MFNSLSDFRELFPDRNLEKEDLTVITLSQRTQNDMTGWSDQVEAERELLLSNVSCCIRAFIIRVGGNKVNSC